MVSEYVFALALCLLAVTVCHCQLPGCTDPSGVTMTPSNNQTVPIDMNISVTYTCTVNTNRRADWEFMGIQVNTEAQNIIDFLAGIGINITRGPTMNEAYITITRAGREFYQNRDLPIACAEFDSTSITIKSGCDYYVRTFAAPSEPENLDFNHFPGNLSRLVLTWQPPDNTIVDTGDPVSISYTIKVLGATHNFTDYTPLTRYEFVDNPNTECAMHNFKVYASNEAGKGGEALINETIPISPDIDDLSDQLRVNKVTMGSAITVEVTFPKATACSMNFLVDKYLINIMGVVSTAFSPSDPRIAGMDQITLTTNSMAIQPNMAYSLTVSACISVTCRESAVMKLNTSDVQSARVTFFESNIFLSCSFATNSQAQGCLFVFTVSPNITEEFTITRAVASSCAQLMNNENVYSSIQVWDLESDGSRGNLVLIPVRGRAETVEEYMTTTGCSPPPPAVGLPIGGTVGIVLAVLILVAITVAVIAVIVVFAMKNARKEVKVDCIDCAPESKQLLDRSGGHVATDGGRDSTDRAQGGPPPISPPPFKKLMFNLFPGRKNGEMVIDRNMLDELTRLMKDDNTEVTYKFQTN